MNDRQLPPLVATGPGGTFENAREATRRWNISGPEVVHLYSPPPPYTQADLHVPVAQQMERATSVSSATSTESVYTSFQPSPPMDASYEVVRRRQHSRYPATPVHSQDKRSMSPDPQSLSDSSKTVRTETKPKRAKRKDRRMFAEIDPKMIKKQAPYKSGKEGGNRFLQAAAYAVQQQTMLALNPKLPGTAAPGRGHSKQGLTPLRTNNVSDDILELGLQPLQYKKVEIMNTCTLGTTQLAHASVRVESELSDFASRLEGGLNTGACQNDVASLVVGLRRSAVYMRSVREHVGEPMDLTQDLPGSH